MRKLGGKKGIDGGTDGRTNGGTEKWEGRREGRSPFHLGVGGMIRYGGGYPPLPSL